MPVEPADKYAVAFIDGQNLFQHAMRAFGHFHPNYDVKKLHQTACGLCGCKPTVARFYTGVPSHIEDPMWAAIGQTGFSP